MRSQEGMEEGQGVLRSPQASRTLRPTGTQLPRSHTNRTTGPAPFPRASVRERERERARRGTTPRCQRPPLNPEGRLSQEKKPVLPKHTGSMSQQHQIRTGASRGARKQERVQEARDCRGAPPWWPRPSRVHWLMWPRPRAGGEEQCPRYSGRHRQDPLRGWTRGPSSRYMLSSNFSVQNAQNPR